MSPLKLFEYVDLKPDCFISGTPYEPDEPQVEFMNWKLLAGVALAKEFVPRINAEDGFEFRVIPLTV